MDFRVELLFKDTLNDTYGKDKNGLGFWFRSKILVNKALNGIILLSKITNSFL